MQTHELVLRYLKYTSFLGILVLGVALSSCSGDKSMILNEPHNIRGVNGFQKTFNDNNAVQIAVAQKLGIKPVKGLEEARKNKNLVRLESGEHYKVDSLTHSLPYLTKKSEKVLSDIGDSFLDSLSSKGLNPNRIVVTSVLRTQELISDLKKQNGNSVENSAHVYGTTFDISWKSFEKIEYQGKRPYESVSSDTLKMVLAEVMRDFQKKGRCYVKYEVNQGCFHITSRE